MDRYRAFLSTCRERFPQEEYGKVKEALSVAIAALGDTRRYNSDPMVYHALGVAEIVLNELSMGAVSVLAAILHDVVRTGALSLDDAGRVYGSVCSLSGFDSTADIRVRPSNT